MLTTGASSTAFSPGGQPTGVKTPRIWTTWKASPPFGTTTFGREAITALATRHGIADGG